MRTDTLILYRAVDAASDEQEALARHFRTSTSRLDVQAGDLVIGRYSVLPFYRELERDVLRLGGKLINSYAQHQYLADLREWYQDLSDLTFPTWFRLEDVPKDGGPFVLKGATNSIKQKWSTHMFAATWAEAGNVYGRLCDDGFVGMQPIYIRQYVPLRSFGVAIGGHPVTHEFRFFVLDGQVLCGGYYWAGHVDLVGSLPAPSVVPDSFLQTVLRRVGSKARFYVVDVAEKADGEWIVVELNDGQMSGLSCITPETLYASLGGRFS